MSVPQTNDEFTAVIRHEGPGRPATQAEITAHFDLLGNTPIIWRVYGRQLLSTSATLLASWNEGMRASLANEPSSGDWVSHLGPAAMLRGMAAECYLKALGLERGKFLLASGGKFNRKIPGLKNQHDLVRLAGIVDFPLLGTDEERAMRALARGITAGRYPIPTSADQFARLTPDGGIGLLPGGTCDAVSDGILARLAKGQPSKPLLPVVP
jgi:hypothetical protein